jgi:hypothetical protein
MHSHVLNKPSSRIRVIINGYRNAIRAILQGKLSQSVTGVEAGSNTSTATLRDVGGDEKGSLKSETVKYDREFRGTRTRKKLRWQGPVAYTKDRPVGVPQK